MTSIPTAAARRISRDYAVPIVVVLALDSDGDLVEVVSHGASPALGELAGSIGERIALALQRGHAVPSVNGDR